MMNQPIQLHPDVLQKFEQFVDHSANKHKVIHQFMSILKNLCEIQQFYSRNLLKLAQSTSKLIYGKDALKEVFIIFQRLLSSKSDEAKNLAQSVKNDMIPFVKDIINPKQYLSKNEEKRYRELRQEMEKKHRGLDIQGRQYLKCYIDLTQHSSLSSPQLKNQMKQNLTKKQKQIGDFIRHYNLQVESYLLQLSELTNKFTESECNRKKNIKASINKYMIFQINAIKNVEYNIGRYCKELEQMDDKLAINEKIQDVSERVSLAKISTVNYLEYLRSQALENGLKRHQIQTVRGLHEKYRGQLDQSTYNQALRESYPLLDHLMLTRDIPNLKKLLHYGNTVYKILPDMDNQTKILLTEGMFCHDLFTNRPFWESYTQDVAVMLERENGAMCSNEQNAQEELEEEIKFIRSIKLEASLSKHFFERIEKQMKKLNFELKNRKSSSTIEEPSRDANAALNQSNNITKNPQNSQIPRNALSVEQPNAPALQNAVASPDNPLDDSPQPTYSAQQYDAFL